MLLDGRLGGYHLSTTAAWLPESLSLPPASKFVLLWSDWWQVSHCGLPKFPILPQGNCSFLHKSISILARQRRAKFMHYAGTWTQNCDELRDTLDGVGKIYILICVTLFVCFFSWMPCQGGYCCKVIYKSKQAWHSYLDNHLTPSLSQLLQDLNCHCDIVEGSFLSPPAFFKYRNAILFAAVRASKRLFVIIQIYAVIQGHLYHFKLFGCSSSGAGQTILQRPEPLSVSFSSFFVFLLSTRKKWNCNDCYCSKGTCCNSTETKWDVVGWVWPVSDLERPSTVIVRFSKSRTHVFSGSDAHTLDFINLIQQAHHRAFYNVTTEAAPWARKLPLMWMHWNPWTPALCHFIYCHLYTSSM